MASVSSTGGGRRVVGNISLSIDGRVTGPGGDMDMGWVARHAVTDAAREHMVRQTNTATTILQLRRADGGDIIVQNSVSIFRQLLAADEIDRLTLTFCPEIVGAALGCSWTACRSRRGL